MNYPYYIAIHREGRLKGQYPSPEIQHIPSLRKKWDRGGFGSGTSMKEFKSDDIQDLLNQLRTQRLNPIHDEIEFYIIQKPNSARQGIQYQRLMAMMNEEPREKSEMPEINVVEPIGRAMSYATKKGWYKKAQEVIDKPTKPTKPTDKHESYFSIGHTEDDDISLWAFIDGKLEVKSRLEAPDHVRGWNTMEWDHFRGRFDPKTKKLSVVNPFEGRRIPNVLLKKLYDEFGVDIQIYEYF